MNISRFYLPSIVFMLIVPALFPLLASADLSDEGALSSHNPIHINGNAQFTLANGVVSGNGTGSNPYIIENWTINAANAHGIWIENTNAYFIIRNCNIKNGSSNWKHGVYLDDLANGRVEDSRLQKNDYGILLSSASNIVIHNNTIFNASDTGLFIADSGSNKFSDNTIHDCPTGIFLERSSGDKFYNNTLYNNTYHYNIYSYSALVAEYVHTIPTNNTVDGKPVYYWVGEANKAVPTDAGFVGLVNCDNITAKGLDLGHNGDAIILVSTVNSNITNNTLHNNAAGIFAGELPASNNDRIFKNTLFNNAEGIKVYARDLSVYNNTVYNNTDGIGVHGQVDSRVYWNRIYNNTNGINVNYYSGNQPLQRTNIFENTLYGNSKGILIEWAGSQMRIHNNSLYSNTYGIYSHETGDNYFYDNSIHNNSYGFFMYQSSYGSNVLYDNVIFNNSYNFGVSGSVKADFTHTIYPNNTVNGRPIRYYVDQQNLVVPSDAGFVGLVGCTNVTVKGLDLDHEFDGVLLAFVDKARVLDTTGENDHYGIRLLKSKNVKIDNVTFDKSYIGVEFGGSSYDTLNRSVIRGSSSMGVELDSSPNNLINGNHIYRIADTGAYISADSNYVTVANNTVNNTKLGIVIRVTSEYCVVLNNTVYNNSVVGIEVFDSTHATVHHNTVFNSTDGIDVEFYTSNNKVYNNTIHDNSVDGMYISSDTNMVYNNSIYKNKCGIDIRFSSGNLIYNNYFSNTGNLKEWSNTNNRWNISTTSGTNIVGGPKLGGNYWSDYAGYDLNQDGFGDTAYNSEDKLPLFIPDHVLPWISDNATASPTTGETYTLKAKVSDDRKVINATVEYWIDGGAHTNKTVTLSSGNSTAGIYNLVINIGASALNLEYFFSARDSSGNWNRTKVILRRVLDNDLPTVSDATAGSPTTGDNYTISATATDNINVSEVRLQYWFDWGVKSNASLDPKGGSSWKVNITIASNATKLSYDLTAYDNSSNMKKVSKANVVVKDNDAPTATDLTNGTPTTNDDFSFNVSAKDNIGLQTVSVKYWFDGGNSQLKTLALSGGVYTGKVTAPSNAKKLHYIVQATDKASNSMSLSQVDLDVLDNDAPVIQDKSGAPTTGDKFNITAKVTDNIAVGSIKAEYWFDNGTHQNISMVAAGGNYRGEVSVPLDAWYLHYILSANDTSNNTNRTLQVDLKVLDNDPPTVQAVPGNPATGMGFQLTCDVQDNRDIHLVSLEYWFDDQPHNYVNMVDNEGYVALIQVPVSAHVLNFIIKAYDGSNNMGAITGNMGVVDTISPTITDTTGVPTTGDQLSFSVLVQDNWAVAAVHMEYWFDNDVHKNVSYHQGLTVDVPSNATMLNYIISANDSSGNIVTLMRGVGVVDNDRPVITDQNGVPTTGDNYTFKFSAQDNIGLCSTYLGYSFDGQEWTNVSYKDGLSVGIPVDAKNLWYNLTVTDLGGNRASVSNVLSVTDNDPPVIQDLSGTPETGKAFVVRVEAKDNIGVEEVNIRYWFDEKHHTTGPMTFTDGNYTRTIDIPDNARMLNYSITVADHSGLETVLNRSLKVVDVIGPQVTDRSTGPVTGKGFVFDITATDNIGIAHVNIEYWFDLGKHVTIDRDKTSSIDVPQNATKLHYSVNATDMAGNFKRIEVAKDIADDILPILKDLTEGEPVLNGSYIIKAQAEDNIGISSVMVVYWFKHGAQRALEMSPSNGSYSAKIYIGSGEDLHYIIQCTDSSKNTAYADEKTLPVKQIPIPVIPPDHPKPASFNWMMFGAIVVILIVVIAVIVIIIMQQSRDRISRGKPPAGPAREEEAEDDEDDHRRKVVSKRSKR